MNTIIKLGKQEITHNPFRVSLTERRDGQGLPRTMEIESIKLNNVNIELLDEVSIYIGGAKVFSFEGQEINNIVIPEEGILLSKCDYHCVDMYFQFNKQFLRDISKKIVLEDEYETQEIETNKYVYVRNPETNRLDYRNVVKVIKKPTGRKIEVSKKDPIVEIPDIEVTLKPKIKSSQQIIESTFWQKYLVTPEYDTWDFIKSMIDRFELKMDDEKSVEEYYKKGRPFYAKIKNKLIYNGGFAGVERIF